VGSGGSTSTTYVVHPGDSLWSIARHALPPDVTDAVVAAAVADLYVANRATLGPDPDLLRPGQRLRTATLSRLRDHITHQEER
jgi:LysM repeat protein